ncbi:MAG: hypothetical protein ACE5M4_13545 [Anaerolineales bacterium]
MFVKRLIWLNSLAIILGAGIMVGCGPSAEEQAATSVALTAAAATSTPTVTPTHTPTPTSTPTPTPTPIPYDLSVLVTGEDDIPIEGARVAFLEVDGDAGAQITDDAGQVAWADLPGEIVILEIGAQGYFSTEASEVIERGANQLTIVLERDPHGMLPVEACGPNEHILYIEDLQDGHANGWEEIEFRALGLDIGPRPDEPADNVILFSGGQEGRSSLQNLVVNDVAWRTHLMSSGPGQISFNWRVAPEPYDTDKGTVNDSRYILNLEETSYILRMTSPVRELWVAGNPYRLKTGVWHTLEIGNYGGDIEAWIDGFRILAYRDPDPLPEGGIFISLQTSADDTSIYLDDISVCELTTPFSPLPTPEPEN